MNKEKMIELIDEWSTAGFEEGKYHSEYGKGVFHEKYASPHLAEYRTEIDERQVYIIKSFDMGSAPQKEALQDLNKILDPEGYKATYGYEDRIHQDIIIEEDR